MKGFYSIIAVCCLLLFHNTASGQQTITIGTGTSISAFSPQNHATAYTVTEIIYLQSEINTSGVITSLAFEKHDGTNLDSIQNVQIFLTHTNATSYTATVFDTTGEGYIEVYNGSFPNNALTGWMEVQLQTPFQYNNTQNLQVLFLKTNSPTNGVNGERARYRYSVPGGSRLRRYNNNTPYQMGVTGLTTTNFTPNIKLTFAPPGPPVCAVLGSPANNSVQICPDNPEFNWSMPFGIPATDFEFYLGTDGGGSTFPTNVLNGTLTGNVNSFNFTGVLNANTTYYWGVIGVNATGSSTGCAINSFTTGNAAPVISVITSPPGPLLCTDDSANVNVTVTGGTNPFTYQWSSGQTTATIQTGAGNYTISVTDSISCEVTQYITISAPSPMVSNFSATPDTSGNCNGTVSANPSGGTPPYTVTWLNSGTTINLCSGWYTAIITDGNGCEKTDSVFVSLITGIHEPELNNLSVYPNPATAVVFISALNREIGEIKMFNITGELVKRFYCQQKETELFIDELNPGIYFLELQNKNFKIIKQ